MRSLDELTRDVLQDFDSGLATRGETFWRLVRLIDQPAEVDRLIAHLPQALAESWIAWALASFRDWNEDYLVIGCDNLSLRDKRSIEMIRAWLQRPPPPSPSR
jgi:hypothetical protein